MAGSEFGRRKGIELNVTNVIILTTFTLAIIQGIGLVLNPWLGTKIFLGPVFIILAVMAASTLGFVLVKKLLNDSYISKQDMFAVVIVAILAILVLIFLRDLVPEVFEQSMGRLVNVFG